MRTLLIDESLPLELARLWRLKGGTATHIAETPLRGQPDDRILEEARRSGCPLVTVDVEFASILRFPPETHGGVILVRIPELVGRDRRIVRTIEALEALEGDSLLGTVVVIEASRTRVRKPKRRLPPTP